MEQVNFSWSKISWPPERTVIFPSNSRKLNTSFTLTPAKIYRDVNVTIHEMFWFVRMFSRIRNGWHLYHPVDMLQSKQVRLLLRNKIKRWTCVIYLCHMPMRSFVFSSAHLQSGFCFTDEEGSYLTNGGTLGSQQNLQFRIFSFNLLGPGLFS